MLNKKTVAAAIFIATLCGQAQAQWGNFFKQVVWAVAKPTLEHGINKGLYPSRSGSTYSACEQSYSTNRYSCDKEWRYKQYENQPKNH